ncbi:dihydroorotate dehydrogenase [Ruminococcaceae bacterium OttesenSCG-928-L11]|nr:dihydroorotate dehydrogenase [Ruminococcaceae bacterium OttesenSCG-928-L11]
MHKLETTLCDLTLKNPIITASGTFGYGEEFSPYMDVSRLGGICSKGLTLNPKEGNYGVRMWETPSGMLNSVGLQNPGVAHFIENELPIMRKFDTAIIANMGGGTIEEYVEGAALLDKADIDMLELNISCPNVKEGGMAFGIKADVAWRVVNQVRKVYRGKMMVKLSPNAEDIVAMAVACEEAGADAISLINTLKGTAIDVYKRKPVFRNTVAGLSGPAIKPVALRMVWEVAKAVEVPVVGLGGIATGMDAIEFIMAGATAVQVGTANFVRPHICLDIIEEMEAFMESQGIQELSEIRGCI